MILLELKHSFLWWLTELCPNALNLDGRYHVALLDRSSVDTP
jgi:hypothetical protein